jgi:hypothetical protein
MAAKSLTPDAWWNVAPNARPDKFNQLSRGYEANGQTRSYSSWLELPPTVGHVVQEENNVAELCALMDVRLSMGYNSFSMGCHRRAAAGSSTSTMIRLQSVQPAGSVVSSADTRARQGLHNLFERGDP